MATRFYFGNSTFAAVNPTPNGGWLHAFSGDEYKLLTTPDSSTLATVDYSPDAGDDLVDGEAMNRMYVSDPLAAQSILEQTVKIQMQGNENNNGNNCSLTWHVWLVSNNGTTWRANLIDIQRDSNEFPTTLVNRGDTGTTPVSISVTDGDRIVVEVGIGGWPTAAGGTQGHNGDLRFGCNASSGDLPENDTETGTTYRGWIEFANTLTFQSSFSPGRAYQATQMIGVGVA